MNRIYIDLKIYTDYNFNIYSLMGGSVMINPINNKHSLDLLLTDHISSNEWQVSFGTIQRILQNSTDNTGLKLNIDFRKCVEIDFMPLLSLIVSVYQYLNTAPILCHSIRSNSATDSLKSAKSFERNDTLLTNAMNLQRESFCGSWR